MMQITPTVKQLLIINIIFFIGSQIVGDAAYEYLSLFYFESPKFQYWQPLTHMFMHGGIMHIAFNMFALYSFGSVLEHYWGGKRFLFFYLSCGFGAAALHTAVNYFLVQHGLNTLLESGIPQEQINSFLQTGSINYNSDLVNQSVLHDLYDAYNTPAVGASGAIYGLLVAFAFMAPNAELALMFIPIPIKAKYFVPGLLCVDLFLGVKGNSIFGGGDGIAHFAHVGGAIIGFLMMWYWKKNSFNKNRWN
jgi:membrane associated rhomboid family serine protease